MSLIRRNGSSSSRVLGAPNHEVRGAIRAGWFDSFLQVPSTEFDALVNVAKRQVGEGRVVDLINETLYRINAKIPPEWRIRCEADVKRHFRLFMEMLGAKVGEAQHRRARVREAGKVSGLFTSDRLELCGRDGGYRPLPLLRKAVGVKPVSRLKVAKK